MADKLPVRINQPERLFTVRERSRVSEERGSAASIRYHLPDPDDRWQIGDNIQSDSGRTLGDFDAMTDEELLGYIDFVLQNISYNIQEKSQIVQTFGGAEAVYFYGKSPVVVSMTGMITDDLDNDQYYRFMKLYQDFLSGSAASKEYSYVEFSTNNARWYGSFTNITITQDASRDTDITFTAEFLAKDYLLTSTDSLFLDDGEGQIEYVDLRTRIDPKPTLTAEQQQQKLAEDASADATAGISLGDYARLTEKLPSLNDLLPFSASDITDFFGDINDIINQVTKPIEDISKYVSQFANDAISYVEAVENGVESIVNNVESATESVFGAANQLEDAFGTLINFPSSMVEKLGNFGNTGAANLIAGSANISAADAVAQLASVPPTGAARGTPVGDSALIAVTSLSATSSQSSADQGAQLPVPTRRK